MKVLQRILAIGAACALCCGLMTTAFAAGVDHHYTVVSGGMSHTLAVDEDGAVWAWGSNESGQLGQSGSSDEKEPVEVEGLDAVSVAAGFNFSAALEYDGTVQVWGNGAYQRSQVPGLSGVTAIAAGQTDLLALKYDGTVWQWTMGGSAAPRQVSGLSRVAAVAAGGGHYLALTSSGQVYAWGRNDHGQLGLGDNTDRTAPALVTELSDIVDISAGYSHSLAADFSGRVYAWGTNTYGQLGNDSTEESSVPVEVEKVEDAVQVAAGNESSMALTEDGKIYTWGYGEYGQLGDNSAAITQTTPVAARTSSVGEPVQIACGLYHNLLVNDRGYVYTWGRNRNGQLGTGKDANGTTPQRILSLGGSSGYELLRYELNTLDGLNSWSEEEISALYEAEIVSPMLWCDFGENITRAEFAHLLVNLSEEVKGSEATPSSRAKFEDIQGHPLEQDILKAYQLDLLSGRSDTVFAPDDNVTRQEAAKLLCSLIVELENVRISDRNVSLSYYSDASRIGDWAVPFVAYAYEKDIMKGTGDQFNPTGNMTREQCLLTVARLVEQYDWAS